MDGVVIFGKALPWTLFGLLLGFSLSKAADPEKNTAWPLGLEPVFHLPDDPVLNAATVKLGKKLFFDKNLSKDRSLSCAGCHKPELGFADGQPLATGVGGVQGERNVPTIVNRLLGTDQFWDGRAASLEDQVLGPLFAPSEMAMTEELVLHRLKADPDYPRLFQEALGEGVSIRGLARAIAAFERTVMTGASRFDRFEWRGEKGALTQQEKWGLSLFRGKASCSLCHTGTNFSDEKFHNLGVGIEPGSKPQGRSLVTGNPSDQGGFKTPTLRNIALTAPYMHDGSLATLEAVVDYYDRGCEPNPHLAPEIKPLALSSQEKQALIAFLKSLTGPVFYVDPGEIMAMAE